LDLGAGVVFDGQADIVYATDLGHRVTGGAGVAYALAVCALLIVCALEIGATRQTLAVAAELLGRANHMGARIEQAVAAHTLLMVRTAGLFAVGRTALAHQAFKVGLALDLRARGVAVTGHALILLGTIDILDAGSGYAVIVYAIVAAEALIVVARLGTAAVDAGRACATHVGVFVGQAVTVVIHAIAGLGAGANRAAAGAKFSA